MQARVSRPAGDSYGRVEVRARVGQKIGVRVEIGGREEKEVKEGGRNRGKDKE